MSRKELIRELERLCRGTQLVRFDRSPLASEVLQGYVVGVSDSLVMLHVVDDSCHLCGYCVFQVRSIGAIHVRWKERSLLHRALVLRGESPVELPGVSLAGWKDVFQGAKDMYPLVAIYCEKMDNTICWIGQVRKVSSDGVTIRKIDPSAQWTRSEAFRFEAITYVAWGGGYEEALWAVACDDKKRAELKKRKSQ